MTDIIAALNMLEEEKNISKEMMIDSICFVICFDYIR